MLILALALLLPFAPPQLPGVSIVSEEPSTVNGDIFRFTKNVIVTYQDLRVEADWIEHNIKTGDISAGDHVRLFRGNEQLSGEKLVYNLQGNTGVFSGNVQGQVEPGLIVRAEEMERHADNTWTVRKSSSTACEGECPAWRFEFSEARIEPGKRVTGKNAVFRFQGVPIVWLPGASIPTASRDRSSGFLMPSTSTSTTKGRSLRLPFYWAVNRSMDATFTSEYFSKRGPAGAIDFRAVPNANTSIAVSTFFAIDTRDQQENREDQGGHRTNISASSYFGDGWRGVADIDITSEFLFRQVYEEGFNVISSPIESSRAFVTNNRAERTVGFLYDRTAVFLEPSVALRRFPAVDFSLPTRRLSPRIPLYFRLDAGFAGVARRDNRLNTPPLMQRLDVNPVLELPLLQTRALRWNHSLGVRNTLYTHSIGAGVEGNALNRAIVDYSFQIGGPQLERNFSGWRHVVEPTIEYRYRRGVDRFQQTVVVDEVDMITDTHEVEYAITNRFLAGHEFLTWKVAQKLYFDRTFGGALVANRRNVIEPFTSLTGFAFSDGTPRRFSPIVSTVRIATSPQTSTDIEIDYDTHLEEVRSAGVMGSLNRGEWIASIAYFLNKRTTFQSPNNQLRGNLRYGSSGKPGLGAGFSFYYDVAQSLWQGSTAQIGYNFECFGVNLDFTQYNIGDRNETRFRFSLSLKNLGSFGTLRPQERLF
jgi:LPS-assembly protein